jgi:sugar (pentulose or hexulose) kinase
MTHRYILTIDCGISSTKTVLWDEDGRIFAQESYAYSLNRPESHWAEIDSNDWWRAVCSISIEVIAKTAIKPRDIAGTGVDGASWTLIPVDYQAQPLSPAIIWLDRCADKETRVLNELSNRRTFEPSPERHAMYEELFQVNHRVARRIPEDSDDLATISRTYGLGRQDSSLEKKS